MAEIINFRMARKSRDRAKAEQQATENRAKFCRTKAQKIANKAETERSARTLDGARREADPQDKL